MPDKKRYIIFRDYMLPPLKEWKIEKGRDWHYCTAEMPNTDVAVKVYINPGKKLVQFSVDDNGEWGPMSAPVELINQALEYLAELQVKPKQDPKPVEPEEEADW